MCTVWWGAPCRQAQCLCVAWCMRLCPQRWQPEDIAGLDLNNMLCVVCGRNDDEAHLLLCDGGWVTGGGGGCERDEGCGGATHPPLLPPSERQGPAI